MDLPSTCPTLDHMAQAVDEAAEDLTEDVDDFFAAGDDEVPALTLGEPVPEYDEAEAETADGALQVH